MLAGAIGKPVSSTVLRRLNIPHAPLTWAASFAGALLGSFSHIILDAVMHADMRPWWPFRTDNPLLYLMGIDRLHLACALTGLLGLAVIALRAKRGRRG